MWKISEKQPFFRADMAGLGKYCMGGYGQIGVYRVNMYHFVKILHPIVPVLNKINRVILHHTT